MRHIDDYNHNVNGGGNLPPDHHWNKRQPDRDCDSHIGRKFAELLSFGFTNLAHLFSGWEYNLDRIHKSFERIHWSHLPGSKRFACGWFSGL